MSENNSGQKIPKPKNTPRTGEGLPTISEGRRGVARGVLLVPSFLHFFLSLDYYRLP
jgi:hypothetical protein